MHLLRCGNILVVLGQLFVQRVREWHVRVVDRLDGVCIVPCWGVRALSWPLFVHSLHVGEILKRGCLRGVLGLRLRHDFRNGRVVVHEYCNLSRGDVLKFHRYKHDREHSLHGMRRRYLRHHDGSAGNNELLGVCRRPVLDHHWQHGLHGVCRRHLQHDGRPVVKRELRCVHCG